MSDVLRKYSAPIPSIEPMEEIVNKFRKVDSHCNSNKKECRIK